ncbi:helix-turn-helix transcriptional regulator [Nocardia pseudobrasiliensis]|uniref:HTH-type transcriptional regulator RipA n=1 Tax=Nocardia pseudobrasiliensis TaxID=45979 RepID=A0A370I8T8_9NOCA|nr:AraC family transcriptional regulator [Nocardia pseudobrasiliensis]
MSIIRHAPIAPTHTRYLTGDDRIDRHRHDDHQLVFPSSGAAEVRTAAGSWIAPGDRAIWIPAGCWHEHDFHGPTRFHTVGFAAHRTLGHRTPLVLTVTPLVRELIIACTTAEDLPAAELDRMREVLLDQLRRSPEQPLRLPVPTDPRLRAACALVDADLTAGRTLAELGRTVGASERTLTRLFRAELGMTYPQWRTHLRLHRATRLLAEGDPVTSVALNCGWSSPSAFIDVYRRFFGHTPGSRRSAPGM